jgi:hypothetical protein
MQLRKAQEEFKQAILNPELAEAYGKKWLHNFRGVSAEERLSVYRTNIFSTLTKALSSVYPITTKVIGEQGFKQLAQQYIHYKFPTEACLLNYGDEMPAFIKTIPMLMESVPYLSDLATFEWLCHKAAHAPIEKTVTRDDLESLNESKFSDLPLKLTSAFGAFKTNYPLQTIIEYVQQDSNEQLRYSKGTHHFLIYRFFGEVLDEEISETFYETLLFLKAKKGKSAKVQSVNDLSNFMIAQGHPQETGAFIHFLFNRNLIQQM